MKPLIRSLQFQPTRGQIARFVVSLLLATLLWGWVTQLQDPFREREFSGVPVAVAGLPDTLQVVSSVPEVDVTLGDAESRLNEIRAPEITVRIDSSGIENPGTYTVPLIVDSPGVNTSEVEPDEVSIQVEDRVTMVVALTIQTEDAEDQSRRIRDVDTDVSQVTIQGPSSAVDRVQSVILPVELGEQVNDFDVSIQPYAADSAGQPVTEVDILPADVPTRVEVETRGKSVSVIANTRGTPAEGFSIEQRRAIPDTIVVDGPPEVLADLLFVNTEAVDVTGAAESFSVSDALVDLPEGVRVIDASGGSVEVRVAISNANQSSQSLSGIDLVPMGLEPGLTAQITPPQVTLQVTAPVETLQAIQADDIAVFVDVRGLGPGAYTLEPEVTVPQGVTWLGNDPARVQVIISRAGAEAVPVTPGQSTPIATPA